MTSSNEHVAAETSAREAERRFAHYHETLIDTAKAKFVEGATWQREQSALSPSEAAMIPLNMLTRQQKRWLAKCPAARLRSAPSEAAYDPTTQPFDEPFRHVDATPSPAPEQDRDLTDEELFQLGCDLHEETTAPEQRSETQITAAEVLAWFEARPGASWKATIADIQEAVRDIATLPHPAPAATTVSETTSASSSCSVENAGYIAPAADTVATKLSTWPDPRKDEVKTLGDYRREMQQADTVAVPREWLQRWHTRAATNSLHGRWRELAAEISRLLGETP